MKTKDLIKLLQETDPSGELQCSVNGVDIYFAQVKAGYWDGVYQVLIKEKDKCNVIGAEYRSDGDKLCIETYSIKDAMLDDPNIPVKVVDCFCNKQMQKTINKWRKEIKEVIKKVDKENKK